MTSHSKATDGVVTHGGGAAKQAEPISIAG